MMEAMFILSILGVSLGSFINVCVYRLPRGLSPIALGSSCPRCHCRLRWYELIPVLSYILLKGKCSSCSTRVSLRYPLIEIVSGAIVLLLFRVEGASAQFVYQSIFLLLMIPVAIIDWEHLIIPNVIVGAGVILGLLLNRTLFPDTALEQARSGLLSFAIMLCIYFGGNFLFQKQALGMGDVKLAGLLGVFLGLQGFLITLWLAAILGLAYAVGLSLMRPVLKPDGGIASSLKIPLGTFLAIASSVILLLSEPIDRWMESWLNLVS